ncbi:GNAT family N-acetyltransferase [Streptomyces sp. NPDC048171]|uniref:GNAT family N-acetyltransferase n=1 Tax=unclassified Streptomyces TaxID=2593676 RepID=UPI0013695CA6|nr:GNAT family N-acetyltransferase [Streptomyces sp. SID5789]MZE74179.1 GNAT family N-acetyltransferase [Streptomyces sp. SID5789]
MRPDDWHFTEDLDTFLARAGDFLRSRPALHTTQLTTLEKMRTRGRAAFGAGPVVFGLLEAAGKVHAALYRLPSRRVTLTALSPEQADVLAGRLTGLGLTVTGVLADHDTATGFAEAWQRHTGAAAVAGWRGRLHRLGTLTPPEPVPAGRGRSVEVREHEHLMGWCRDFAADVGESVSIDAGTWAGTRFAEKRYTYWEDADGTPVSMAGANPLVGGQVRIDPVYTPARLRGRGYAGAVTVAVTRAALNAGATDVVLFTDPANLTSNALYRRIGYLPYADFTGYDLSLGGLRYGG